MNEPIERRIIHGIGAVLGVATWLLIIWNYLDPDGPQNIMQRIRNRIAEWRRTQEAMQRTLDDIGDLPETESA